MSITTCISIIFGLYTDVFTICNTIKKILHICNVHVTSASDYYPRKFISEFSRNIFKESL